MTNSNRIGEFTQMSEVIRRRHSERVPFDPGHNLAELDLEAILEAARWAPTAHNMQNFEIIVVDDEERLAAIGRVRGGTSEGFIRENYAQLSFSEEELIRKGTGYSPRCFPPPGDPWMAKPRKHQTSSTVFSTRRCARAP
jgi:nitroreductase